MNGRGFSIGLRAALAIFTVTLFVTGAWAAPWERVLHSFNGADGSGPLAADLIFDARGNLYGTTVVGGAYGHGTVFQLAHKVGGGWAETVLHSFNGADGAYPFAGLIFDAAGVLYGTTENGGAYGQGTVFELRQQGVELWTERVLLSFNGTDGASPEAGLIFDAAGNLYGTSILGGAYGVGTVFELSHEAGGGWTETVLHSFNGADGFRPWAGLVHDAAGNLYGTSIGGGVYGLGTVFELSHEAGGGWTETVLHSFNGVDGTGSWASLVLDSAGNLYGTAYEGGDHTACTGVGCGKVFELSPQAGGGWTYKLLHSFNASDGALPWAGLILDAAGNLYGTTYQGGYPTCVYFGCGVVFELSPTADGGWTETMLHIFDPNCHNDGVVPYGGLIMDAAGNLYGTTSQGGVYGNGSVFEITP